jgi:heme exporter protein B
MQSPILALIKKDILLEFRTRHAFYGLLLYMASTIFILYLSFPDSPDAATWKSLFWLIQLFICVNAVAKSFMQEGKGRMLYYYSVSHPRDYILAKIIFNILLMMTMSLISLGLMLFFLNNPVRDLGVFIGITLLGGTGISMVFTLMSAIAAKAQQNAALIAILGFPVLLPQLLLLNRLSSAAFAEVFRQGAVLQLTGIILLLDLLVILMALILFPFLWKD